MPFRLAKGISFVSTAPAGCRSHVETIPKTWRWAFLKSRLWIAPFLGKSKSLIANYMKNATSNRDLQSPLSVTSSDFDYFQFTR